MNLTRYSVFALASVILVALVAACSVPATPTANSNAAGAQSAKGAAAAMEPTSRNNMYKSAPPMTIDVNKKYRATIETAKGNIVIDLFPQDAPQHVNNFVFLAREGFFDGLTFHRVEKNPDPFVIQGGDPLGTGTGGPGYTIPPEIKRSHPKGALAMARLPDQVNPSRASSGSQFYITLDATPFLDGDYTSFGQTTPESMSVVEQIERGDVIKSVTIQEQ